MARWKAIVALLLVALWVPMTSHCYLEEAGFLPFDECCSSETAPPHTDPCDTGCKVVEKAGIHKTHNEQKVIVPAFVATFLIRTLSPPQVNLAPPTELVWWPPDTIDLPQFVACTALPVRAPSFVS